jgi:hypothetical protein
METVAYEAAGTATWRISNEGTPVATLETYRDGTGAVVTARILGDGEAERVRPYRFAEPAAAEQFADDLVASFSYLGCHIDRS